jgi:hypothetical protein
MDLSSEKGRTYPSLRKVVTMTELDAESLPPDESIAALVRGLDAVDWLQMELTARLSPAERVLAGMRAQAFALAALRGTLSKRFPELSLDKLNMRVLVHFTKVKMGFS